MRNKVFSTLLLLLFSGLMFAQTTAPTNLTATVEDWGIRSSVKLAWEHELSGFEVRFEIFKKVGESEDFIKIHDHWFRKDFKDFFVEPGKTYSYYVVAKTPTSVSLPSETVSVTIEEPVVLKGTLTGLVTDETTGFPLMGVKMLFIPKEPHFNMMTNVYTDSLGQFSAELIEGEYFIHAGKQFYKFEYFENASRLHDATPVAVTNQTVTTVNMSLAPFVIPQIYTLKGKITDELGAGVRAHVKVFIQNLTHNNVRYALTNPEGEYSVRLRENDTVIVYAETFNSNYLPEYYNDKTTAQEADILVINQNYENIDFVLASRPAFNNGISGKLADSVGAPVIGHVTAFKIIDGLSPFRVSAVSDSTGNYNLTNLLPGKYILFGGSFPNYIPTYFRYDGMQTFHRSEADTLSIEETTLLSDINFVLLNRVTGGCGVISGNIRDDNGNSVNGAVIMVKNNSGQLVASGVTDTEGNYTVNSLNADIYSLIVNRYDFNETELNGVEVFENNYYSPIVNVALTPLSVTDVNNHTNIPVGFELSQNYPNPFNPETTIKFSIPTSEFVTVKIFDALGRDIYTLVNSTKDAGSYELKVNASNLSSGMYFYNIKAGNFTKTMKMMLIK